MSAQLNTPAALLVAPNPDLLTLAAECEWVAAKITKGGKGADKVAVDAQHEAAVALRWAATRVAELETTLAAKVRDNALLLAQLEARS